VEAASRRALDVGWLRAHRAARRERAGRGGAGAAAAGGPAAGGPAAGGKYLEPYRDVIRERGAGFEALLWSSRESQRARFRAVCEMVELQGRTVLDAGCGNADFLEFLDGAGVGYRSYLGIDALAELVENARRLGRPAERLAVLDFVAETEAFRTVGRWLGGPPEIIVFSGSLNTLEQGQALAVLERAWAACGEALVFNFLCSGPNDPPPARQPGPARRFETLAMLRWALARTELVRYRQDYLCGHDGTVAMRKGGRITG